MNTKVCYKSDSTKETGAKIIAKLKELGGVNSMGRDGTAKESFYFINKNGVITYYFFIPHGYTLLDINEPELAFPREMMVWDVGGKRNKVQRVVFAINNKLCKQVLAYDCEYLKDVVLTNNGLDTYNFAEEIQPTPKEQAIAKLKELTELINQIL